MARRMVPTPPGDGKVYAMQNGEFEKDLTMSIMSGSIMLGNLSRSVLLTGFNGNNEFKQKVLKRGTGVFYNDLKNRKDVTENVITR